jgi:hypothetical protein
VSFDQEDDSFLTFCLLLDSYKKHIFANIGMTIKVKGLYHKEKENKT